MRLKGFSKEEIENFTVSDLKAIEKAIDLDFYNLSGVLYPLIDYKILKEAQPTTKKGKADNAKKSEMNRQADKLRAIQTTPNYRPPKEPTEEDHAYYDRLVRQRIAQKKLTKSKEKGEVKNK